MDKAPFTSGISGKRELKSTKKDATSKGDVSVVSIHLLPYPDVLSN